MSERRKYGVATTINFALFGLGVVDFVATSTIAAGDLTISKDEGAFGNTATTTFVNETGGFYSQAFTAAEMSAKRILIKIVDQTNPKLWEDQGLIIETYGASEAQHNEYAALLHSTTIATLASQTSFTLTTGSADASAYVGAMIIIRDAATQLQKAVGLISVYAVTSKTVTLVADPGIFTMATTDIVEIIAMPKSLPAALADGAGGLPISDAGGQDIDAAVTSIAAIETDTNEIQGKLPTNKFMGSSDGADDDANIAAILVDTAVIGALGAGLTAVPWNSSWDAELQSEVADALVAIGLDHLISAADGDDPVDGSIMAHLVSATEDWSTFVPSTESLQALRDRGDAAWATGAGGSPPTTLQNTTIAAYTSQTSFTLTAGSADNDAYNGAICIITDQSTATQKAVGLVIDYIGSSKTITLAVDPLAGFTFANGDTIDIIASTKSVPGALPDAAGGLSISDAGGQDIDAAITSIAAIEADTNELQGDDTPAAIAALPTAAENRAEMDSNSTQLAAIVADTGELQTDLANGGRLDLLIDLILADTGELQTDWANGGRLDLILDAILVDTDTTIPGLISALNNLSAANVNAEVVDVMRTDTLTELSQAIPSATPTFATAQMLMYMALRNKLDVTSSIMEIHNNAGTIIATKALTEDGTTFSEAEMIAGT